MDDRLFDDQHQSFDDVGQLPYIAGPGLIFKEIPDFGVKGMGFMVADIQALQQRLGNLLDIAFPFAQRRDFDRSGRPGDNRGPTGNVLPGLHGASPYWSPQ